MNDPVRWTVAACSGILAMILLVPGSLAQGASKRDENFDEKWLAETARDIGRDLPRQVDPETRLDSVVAGPGRRLSYVYTLVNKPGREVNVEGFNATMQPLLRSSICGKAGMQWLIRNGVTLAYNYKGSDGKFVSMIEILPQHCG